MAGSSSLIDAISDGDALAYRQTYGATAEKPLHTWDQEAPLEWITESVFESAWNAARNELSSS